MEKTLERIMQSLDVLKDPVTKGTLKTASRFCFYDVSGNYSEDHRIIADFISTVGDFYKQNYGKSLEGYEIREKFRTLDFSDQIKGLSAKAMLKAMANSALDSLRNEEEEHQTIHRFFRKLEKSYWREAVKSGALDAVKYNELDSWDKLKLLNLYNRFKEENPQGTKWDFVKSQKLSSVYVLNRIVKDYSVKKDSLSDKGPAKVLKFKYQKGEDSQASNVSESVPIVDILNSNSIRAVMDLIP